MQLVKIRAGQVQNYLRQGAGNPKELDDKIFTMKKGESSDEPIKTDFGYHVVKIDDIRKIKVPSEKDAKAQASQILRSEKLNQIIEDLNKKYDVKFLIDQSPVQPKLDTPPAQPKLDTPKLDTQDKK